MKTCSRMDMYREAWENGHLSAQGYGEFSDHLKNCSACRRMYRNLVPLMQRDAGLPAALSTDAGPVDLEDRIMMKVNGARRTPPVRVPLRIVAAACAAVFLVFLGFRLAPSVKAGGEVLVHFSLTAPGATKVSLAGDFTDWDAGKLQLKDPDNDGVWEIHVRLQKDHSYTYNFIIDEEIWIPDPESLIQVDDGFGGESSLLTL